MKYPLFLASKSPRRKELLSQAGLRFQVYVPKSAEKSAPKRLKGAQEAPKIVRVIAEEKAKAALKELQSKGVKRGIILAADTLVFFQKEIIGKPKNRNDALQMLKKLSANQHIVITAVSLIAFSGKKITKKKSITAKTKVIFRQIYSEEFTWYLNTKEPYDKAGAYGAQGKGAAFIQKIVGSYSNVVGLPLAETLKILGEVSAAPWQN